MQYLYSGWKRSEGSENTKSKRPLDRLDQSDWMSFVPKFRGKLFKAIYF